MMKRQDEPQYMHLVQYLNNKLNQWQIQGHSAYSLRNAGPEVLANEFLQDPDFRALKLCRVVNGQVADIIWSAINAAASPFNYPLVAAADVIRDAILTACGIQKRNSRLALAGIASFFALVVGLAVASGKTENSKTR